MFSNNKILTLSEKTILSQMEIEKKMNSFNQQQNVLKNSSIMKKTDKEKREVYLELKRQEEERIRKEKEDELKIK